MHEKNPPVDNAARMARYLEKNAIKIVPETAAGLGRATFRFWKIGKSFLDVTEIGAITYNTQTEKVEPIPERALRRMARLDGFGENVLEPLEHLLYLAEGNLHADLFGPLYSTMRRLKKIY
jgi:hypothetical protein